MKGGRWTKSLHEMNPEELYEAWHMINSWHGKKPPVKGSMFRNEMTPEDLYADYHRRGYGAPHKCGSYLRPVRES